MNMSMHEINTAAETITAAADPDSNIIFGATINPDLEDELIITVVATGFDASYFTNRNAAIPIPAVTSTPVPASQQSSSDDDKALQDVDTQLGRDDKDTADFQKETPMPNIWAIDAEDDSDKPQAGGQAEADRRVITDDDIAHMPTSDDHVVGNILEDDELERPSFLRRLKRRRNKSDEEDTKPHDEGK
jgi:hypothetical protein